MSAMNVVVLVGRLTRDPELKYTPSGSAVCEFSLAIDRAGDKEGDEIKAGFFDVQVWGKSAEHCGTYLAKGRLVGVNGELKHHRWEAQDGTKRSKVEVKAFQVQFLGSKAENQGGSAPDPNVDEPGPEGGSDFGAPAGDLDIPFMPTV